MDIEEFSDCGKDYIRVLNGDDLNAPEVGTYCGRTIPTPITSSGSALMIQFVSDRSVQMSGFRALYTKSMSSMYQATLYSLLYCSAMNKVFRCLIIVPMSYNEYSKTRLELKLLYRKSDYGEIIGEIVSFIL